MLKRSPALLQASHFPESSAAYPAIYLNTAWRVIGCRDGIQWILQYRNRAETVASADWRGQAYCTTREALIRCCDRYCRPINPGALAVLKTLPAVTRPANIEWSHRDRVWR